MLKSRGEPLAQAALVVLYRLDLPITPRVASANFFVDETEVARVFEELSKEGYLYKHPNGAYQLSKLGRTRVRVELEAATMDDS